MGAIEDSSAITAGAARRTLGKRKEHLVWSEDPCRRGGASPVDRESRSGSVGVSRKPLQPNHFASTTELQQAILDFIARYNQTAKPLTWS
jgi:hypothetical protein